ncbi:MAG: TIR domain-containing protein [Sphingomicrobium sp.]
MASVFLSYDRDDTNRARPIALALEKAGHQVWWDLHVRGGAQFSKVIEEALKAADFVVVLWSAQAVESPWVRDEAAAGRDSGRLVPARLDATEPPLGFRQFQTIDLSRWSGRGKVPHIGFLLNALESTADSASTMAVSPETRQPPRERPQWLVPAAVAGLVLAVASTGAWKWLGASDLPVVEVAAADRSPRSIAAANDLFVKLGSLAQVGQGKWQLVDSPGKAGASDLVFRIADTGNDATPRSNLVLLDGNRNSLLWSREFSFDAGQQADLRQLEGLTAGRVLGCALESRQQGHLPADLLKTFLAACASLADLSGDDYGPVMAQLRKIVDRVPSFEPAWSRLIMAGSTSLSYANYTPAFAERKRQLSADVKRVRAAFPNLPELAAAEVQMRDKIDHGKDIERLSAAIEQTPDKPFLLAQLSVANMSVGRMEDAITTARRAAELDPLSVGGTTTYIMTLAHGGHVEAARKELAKAERVWGGTGSLADTQFAFHLRYGDPAIALKLDSEGYNTALYYNARSDPSPTNIAKLKAGIDEFRSKAVSPAQVGWTIQALGQFGLVDDVHYWLGRLSDNELADISYLFFRPALASLRRDGRFMPLAKRIGLVDYWEKSGRWPDFCSRPGIPYDCKKEAAKLNA